MEKVRPRFTAILYLMVFRAVLILTIQLIARMSSKDVWMVLQFFPPVTITTMVSVYTGIFVICNFFLCIPSGALLWAICIQIRLAAEILPIVSVYTTLSIVVALLIRTPHCFEMKTIEV